MTSDHFSHVELKGYRLTLYVSGASNLSRHAISAAKTFCESVLSDRYELVVLDLETHASRANEDGIVATPTLLLHEPAPSKRYVGDLSRIGQVCAAFGLTPPLEVDALRSGC